MHIKFSERNKSLLKLIARILIPVLTGTVFSLLVPVYTRCSENLYSVGPKNMKLFKVSEVQSRFITIEDLISVIIDKNHNESGDKKHNFEHFQL